MKVPRYGRSTSLPHSNWLGVATTRPVWYDGHSSDCRGGGRKRFVAKGSHSRAALLREFSRMAVVAKGSSQKVRTPGRHCCVNFHSLRVLPLHAELIGPAVHTIITESEAQVANADSFLQPSSDQ